MLSSGNCFAPWIMAAYEKQSCSGVCIKPIRDRLISINSCRTSKAFKPYFSIWEQLSNKWLTFAKAVSCKPKTAFYIRVLGRYQPSKMFLIFLFLRNNERRVGQHFDLMLLISWHLPRNVKRPLDVVVLQSLAKWYNENVRFLYYHYFPSPLYCR